MFKRTGHGHGADSGKVDARLGRPNRPRPLFSLSIVSKGYLDAYLKGYATAYRSERSMLDRLEREEAIAEERIARNKAKAQEKRKQERTKILKTQNHQRQKVQGDLER